MSDAKTPSAWLPDFCRLPTLFVVMVSAQVIVLAGVLMPGPADAEVGTRLFVASLFAQWLAVVCTAALCVARAALLRLSPLPFAAALAWGLPVLVAFAGAWGVHAVDHLLGFGLTVEAGAGLRFALSTAAVTGLLSAALLRYLYVQQQWLHQVEASARAEVHALQARIRPHFLFNSLNSIISLVRRDPATAERAVEDLAEVFRAALGAGQGEWTLAEELELIARYLGIEKLRLGERLRLREEFAADVPAGHLLPRLLLQPLVENAILHGVARLAEGGEIHLRARRADGGIEFSVGNPRPARPGLEGGNRHAQVSIERRLQHYFGPSAWMAVAASPGYYSVTVWMPEAGRHGEGA